MLLTSWYTLFSSLLNFIRWTIVSFSGKGTISFPVTVLFWSLVLLSSNDLTRVFILCWPIGLLSTHCFQTLYSSNGEHLKNLTSENMSNSLFWIGVPVTAHLLAARRRQHALEVLAAKIIIHRIWLRNDKIYLECIFSLTRLKDFIPWAQAFGE